MNERRYRAIDLCCGAGGWAVACRGLPIDVVLAVDHWDVAVKTYEINHPDTSVQLIDVREADAIVDQAKAAGIDFVLGAVPCQWISQARRGKNRKCSPAERDAERGTLDSCLAIAKRLDPCWWVMEDIIQIRRELPPLVPFEIIDSRDYSAQRRKRLYFGSFIRPMKPRQPDSRQLKDVVRPGPYRIGKRGFGRRPMVSRYYSNITTLGAYLPNKAPTVCAMSGHDGEMVVVDSPRPGANRQIEWQEQAALQGFPQDYLFYGSAGDVSQMIANAVQIDTARAILEATIA